QPDRPDAAAGDPRRAAGHPVREPRRRGRRRAGGQRADLGADSMSAVWKAARAAVRRRRLQTTVVGVVAGLCTAMIVVALGLLVASSAPFDQAYAKQKGAHLVAAFDPAAVTAAQLTDADKRPEVEAVAGPFPQASVDIEPDPQVPPLTLTVVGRADPAGPVDKLNLWEGRWATAAGEIVLN